MPARVDLYDDAYRNYASEVYRQIRIETYGEDLGQTSWVTTEESEQIPRLLELTPQSGVLEIGCGSGGYALHLAQTCGCHLTGVDVNAPGIHNAKQLAARAGLSGRLRFEQCDVSQPLPFADGAFDAVFATDVLCHIPGRPALLAEVHRVLKPGAGRLLFSDALVLGGVVSHEEIAARSSIGFYLFSPPGENERLLRAAGFAAVTVTDTTANAARIAARWRNSRQAHKEELLATETSAQYEGLQRFLAGVQQLTEERRLLRLVYLARKA